MAGTSAATNQPPSEVIVVGTRGSDTSAAKPGSGSLPAGTVDIIDLDDRSANGLDRPEDAFRRAGIGVGSANEGGLGTGLNLRGFDVGSRLFINGHPDTARLYVRDLATVETISVLKGHASVLYGQGAPGGAVNYLLRQPLAIEQTEARFSIDSHGLKRLVFDHNQPVGDTALRLIYAGQAGSTFIDNLDNRRQSLLLSARHDYDGGTIRTEFEYQRNQRPFAFGTVYAGDRFHYDRYYLAPQAQSRRQYYREALYWQHKLDGHWSLDAALNAAQVKRRETLAGFWTLDSDNSVSSYYRKLDDDVGQTNLRLELRGNHAWYDMQNTLTAGYQQDRQRIDFSGPQNIAGFSIDLDHPDFQRDWNALPLKPRQSQERYRESAFFVLNQLQATDSVRIVAGLRQSDLKIQTGTTTIASTVADIRHLSTLAGVTWTVRPSWSLHLARSESFEPNRGTTRDGGFLQPREGVQWETGIAYDKGTSMLKLALFAVRQSNLTGTDPLDKNALVTLGAIRVRGLETAWRQQYERWSLSTNLSWQRARNSAKASIEMGDKIANVPALYGAVQLSWRASPAWRFWSSVSGTGQRAGDAENSFHAPGYATLDAGARYRFDAMTAFSLEIDNIADKRYIEALSAADNVYQGERRRIVASIEHSF